MLATFLHFFDFMKFRFSPVFSISVVKWIALAMGSLLRRGPSFAASFISEAKRDFKSFEE